MIAPTYTSPFVQSWAGDFQNPTPFGEVAGLPIVGDEDFAFPSAAKQDFMIAPTPAEPCFHCGPRNPEFVYPICHSQSDTAVCDHVARSLVSLIDFASRPMAVLGAIPPVIVFAVKLQPLGAFSHIGEEVLEGVPSFTDGDSSAAVVGITRRIRVRATFPHPLPGFVGWGVTQSMGSQPSPRHVIAEAPAAFGVPRNQISPNDCDLIPTAAATEPNGVLSMIATRTLNNGQTSEFTPNECFGVRHEPHVPEDQISVKEQP